MRYIFLIFSFVLYQNLYAQRMQTQQVLNVADSILKSHVGDKIFRMFKVSEGSYYTYSGLTGSVASGKILSKNKLRKHPQSIHILYHFNSPDIEGVQGASWIILNQKLELTDSIDFAYIPVFLKENSPSTFIERDIASKIAMGSFKENGLRITEPELMFEEKYGKYIYQVKNILTKIGSPEGRETGQLEIAELDAETGNVLAVYKGVYGLIIR